MSGFQTVAMDSERPDASAELSALRSDALESDAQDRILAMMMRVLRENDDPPHSFYPHHSGFSRQAQQDITCQGEGLFGDSSPLNNIPISRQVAHSTEDSWWYDPTIPRPDTGTPDVLAESVSWFISDGTGPPTSVTLTRFTHNHPSFPTMRPLWTVWKMEKQLQGPMAVPEVRHLVECPEATDNLGENDPHGLDYRRLQANAARFNALTEFVLTPPAKAQGARSCNTASEKFSATHPETFRALRQGVLEKLVKHYSRPPVSEEVALWLRQGAEPPSNRSQRSNYFKFFDLSRDVRSGISEPRLVALPFHRMPDGKTEKLISTPTARELTIQQFELQKHETSIKNEDTPTELDSPVNPSSQYLVAVGNMALELRGEEISKTNARSPAATTQDSTGLYTPAAEEWAKIHSDMRDQFNEVEASILSSGHPQSVDPATFLHGLSKDQFLCLTGEDLDTALAFFLRNAQQARFSTAALQSARNILEWKTSKGADGVVVPDSGLEALARKFKAGLCKDCTGLTWGDNLRIYAGLQERPCSIRDFTSADHVEPTNAGLQ